MKVYKGTDENMVCHGKQYVLGEMATEEKAKLCECGLHACEMPLDVLGYYPPNRSRYFEAEAASATGDCGAASATGYHGAASATGKSGVALAAGLGCKAKGALGCAICCVERGKWDGETYQILAVKAAIVDGETIKADTWYMLKGGEFVEVTEND